MVGEVLLVLLVIEALASVAVAAALPVASAVSRIIGLLPGLVYVSASESR